MAEQWCPQGANLFKQEAVMQSFGQRSDVTLQRALGMLSSLYLVSNKSSTEKDLLDIWSVNLQAAQNSDDHRRVMSALLSTIANLAPARDDEGNPQSYYDLQE